MLAAPLLAVVAALSASAGDEARARWSAAPAEVELGEPFELALELEHAPDVSWRALAPAELALDASWVVLGPEPAASAPAGAGLVRTRCAWRVAALEPGERALAEVVAGVALGPGVARIELGDARVRVRGVLAEGEDAPRPLREFPEGFADADAAAPSGPRALVLGVSLAGVALLAAAAWLVARRRARRGVVAAEPAPAERLRALEGALTAPEGCYALTRLLREAGDGLRRKPRPALTDEEWLAEAQASLEIPRGIVDELAAIFERTARVKYAGDTPTAWAVEETVARARRVLAALDPGGARA